MDITVLKIAKRFKEEAYDVFKPKEVYLFGSYVRGTQRYESDIDIAFVYEEYHSDTYLEDLAKLWKLAHKVDIRIEPIILEEKHDPSGFLSEIKKHGIEII